MPARFVNIDRDTPLLLPPDLRQRVPADHPIHYILDAVESLPLTTLRVNERGTGSEQFPPRMMLSLAIYCYATGTFHSCAIERATDTDVAVRFLTGDTHPDHDALSEANGSVRFVGRTRRCWRRVSCRCWPWHRSANC